ncbi:ribosomal protein l37, mitochondrial [Grosmannia clavigera kw1407]|uniref:Large ribosomal subunit protein mL54 n=1 Tax=Grosmannia clavigera (strain kw1407 / UAMH 11150) TaxID=655863 RepID=F0XDB0_GROCL|nr:ribosomal protein l37, mitochondrial [Grosmannia clavigera kw1407]EFX03522.1 ribosomal protein l37, mitochondrial [Grosmannia clavigera kw1407]
MAHTMSACQTAMRWALCRQALPAPAMRLLPRRVLSFSTSSPRAAPPPPPPPPPAQEQAAPVAGRAGEAAVAESDAKKSSCPAGTVLAGLNYFKGRTDPVALADEEYPPWLWDCLDVMKKTTTAEDEDAGDEFSKSKKQRRMAAKRQRDLEAKMLVTGDLEALAPKIPLQHQTINLPVGTGGPEDLESTLLAAAKRTELRVALRKERRATIKESNYLRSM